MCGHSSGGSNGSLDSVSEIVCVVSCSDPDVVVLWLLVEVESIEVVGLENVGVLLLMGFMLHSFSSSSSSCLIHFSWSNAGV